MRMLIWMSRATREDKIRNECIIRGLRITENKLHGQLCMKRRNKGDIHTLKNNLQHIPTQKRIVCNHLNYQPQLLGNN